MASYYGTTMKAGAAALSKFGKNVRKGPSVKRVVTSGRRKTSMSNHPMGHMGALKGRDKGTG